MLVCLKSNYTVTYIKYELIVNNLQSEFESEDNLVVKSALKFSLS